MSNCTEKFSSHILVNSPLPLELLDAVLDELHANREAAGVSANAVDIQIEAVIDHSVVLMRVSMEEVRSDG